MEQEFYSMSETASRLGVSRKVVRRWIDEGCIEGAERAGHSRWRIPRAEIEQVEGREGERPEDAQERRSFDYQVTGWGTKEELRFAADQLKRYSIPYVWKHREGMWALFRSFACLSGPKW